jgi:photosystem II stability/assembly factor-like uncharacterized protein
VTRALARRTIARLALTCLALVPFAAVARGADPPAGAADPAAPAGDPDAAPMIEKKKTADAASPTGDGALYRALTPIEDSEWRAPDPGYVSLLRRIAAGTADKRIMRQHWWLKQRLMPFDRPLPLTWRIDAQARVLADESAPAPDVPDGAALPAVGRWIPAGPFTIPGRVTGLARPGGRPGWILAAMADGGAWLSRDSGQSWEPLAEREATQASGSVLGDPRDPSILYWGTGEGNGAIDNYGGIGLLKSVDGGRTWSRSNSFSSTLRCLAMDASDRAQVWACGNDGVYRSTDAGATFARVAALPAVGASAIAIRADRPQTIFAGLWGGGVHRSVDGGATWGQLAGGLPANIGRADLAICASNPDVIVAAGEINGGDLWRSENGGDNWTRLAAAPDACGGQCWYDLTVAVAPDDCDTIYWGGVGSYVSRDGGQTWAGMPTAGGATGWDFHAFLTAPGGEVISGADGGIHRSTDYGATWASISTTLPTTQYYGGCGHDADPAWLAGGTQDNGTDITKTGEPWRYMQGGDGGKCVLAGQRVMAEFQVTSLTRSVDGGASTQDANAGIGANDRKAWVGIMAKDPQNATTVYVGTNYIYRTRNFHDTAWVQIAGPQYFSRIVTALAVSPADRNVLWAGYEYGGLYRTANALAATVTWTSVKRNLPDRVVSRVTPHPADAGVAWVAQGGYGFPKIWRTDDAGATYVNVTGDLPDVPVTDVAVDPGNTAVLFAGTDLGVFRSVDGGVHWHAFSDGLPLVAIADLFRHPAAGDLVAATHGRSFYRFRAAAAGAVAVPDGAAVPGKALRAERTAGGELWLRWDSEACTAAAYNLFYGPLAGAGDGAYSGAACGLSRGGEAVLPMPGAAGESLFFVVAGANEAGAEGPHGYRSDGTASPASGVGLCGVTEHVVGATCP